mmetsp:Transcript_49442/g.152765  ORF Transcript_49442/g.152765 Transcript_49442/m.152765 type:complete len:114 (-) Transcript_49442:37-378(-)
MGHGLGQSTPLFGTPATTMKAPDTPLATTSPSEAETPDIMSTGKAAERTPATTAGRSSLLRSPAEEEEDEEVRAMPVQVRLFTGDGAGVGSAKDVAGEQVPLSALIEGPPGLC